MEGIGWEQQVRNDVSQKEGKKEIHRSIVMWDTAGFW
jgi:hypothetical protein